MDDTSQGLEPQQLELLLENLHVRAQAAPHPDQQARIHNLAGDLCFEAGHPKRAISYYEKAINIYIADHHYNHAALLCKKIVAQTPEALRAYSNQAWLAIARGLLEEVHQRIGDYVDAAESSHLEELAAKQLLNFAKVTQARGVLETIGEALLELEDSASADIVFGQARTLSSP
jgi:tetratricopeptide (TPR) repeat protein